MYVDIQDYNENLICAAIVSLASFDFIVHLVRFSQRQSAYIPTTIRVELQRRCRITKSIVLNIVLMTKLEIAT